MIPRANERNTVMNVPVIMGLTELKETERVLMETLKPWAVDMEKYQKPMEKELHWTALPALTVAVNRHFANNIPRSGCIAAIFGLVLFADFIHCQVKDDSEGQEYNRDLQFSILIGDLIFGQSVKLLNSINAHELVGIITDMMCIINEAHVMRKISKGDDMQDILAREKACFYRYSFLAAARLGGCGPIECKFYEDLGYDVGMAVTLYDSGMQSASVPFLEKAKSMLSGHRSHNTDNSLIPRLLDNILSGINIKRTVLAI